MWLRRYGGSSSNRNISGVIPRSSSLHVLVSLWNILNLLMSGRWCVKSECEHFWVVWRPERCYKYSPFTFKPGKLEFLGNKITCWLAVCVTTYFSLKSSQGRCHILLLKTLNYSLRLLQRRDAQWPSNSKRCHKPDGNQKYHVESRPHDWLISNI